MKLKRTDKVDVMSNYGDGVVHHLPFPQTVEVLKDFDSSRDSAVTVIGKNSAGKTIQQQVSYKNLTPVLATSIINNQNNTNMNQTMKDAVLKAARELAIANNTFTTLELKIKLRKDEPIYYWTQNVVSTYMNDLATEGKFTYTDNGTYRVYSDPNRKAPKARKIVGKPMPVAKTKTVKAVKVKTIDLTNALRISKTKALELMKNSKGHFFTVVFKKQNGTERMLNGQYVKDQKNSALGYVLVKESSKLKSKDPEPIRNVNLQTLKALKIGGQAYKVA